MLKTLPFCSFLIVWIYSGIVYDISRVFLKESDNDLQLLSSLPASARPPASLRKRKNQLHVTPLDRAGDRCSPLAATKRKGRRRKHFNSSLNGNLCADGEHEVINSPASYVERRAVPKTDYNETCAHCPLPGCNSKGRHVLATVCWEA